MSRNLEGAPRPGRPKGSLNKTTRSIKEAVQQSFDEVGGSAYLVDLAKSDPKAYTHLVSKLIPTQSQVENIITDANLLEAFKSALTVLSPQDAQRVIDELERQLSPGG